MTASARTPMIATIVWLLLVFRALTASAQPAPESRVVVEPDSGLAGISVVVHGFDLAEQVWLIGFSETDFFAEAGTDGMGRVRFDDVLIPDDADMGELDIYVCRQDTLECVRGVFTVVLPTTTTRATTTTSTVATTTIPSGTPFLDLPWVGIGAAVAILLLLIRVFRTRPLDDTSSESPPRDPPWRDRDLATSAPPDTADVPDTPLPPTPSPRWLGVQVTADGENRTRSFKSGSTNTVALSIAPPDPAILRLDEPFPHHVPTGEVHRLDVIVWAPGVMSEPLWGVLDLPDVGATPEPFTIDMDLPDAITEVTANITVLYRSRLVQAATMTGPVVSGPDAGTPEGLRIELARTTPSGIDFSVARAFDATIITWREEVDIRVGEARRHFALGGVRASVELIQDFLFDSAVDAVSGDGSDLGAGLWALAAHGHALYLELIKGETAAIADASTIEVISRDPGDFLPVELVYDRGDPDADPEVCPNWQAAFERDEECVDCPAWGNGSRFVCPLGFWGLSKEIARRISVDLGDEGLAAATVSAPVAGRERLMRFGPVMVGASRKVDAGGGPSQIDATVEFAGQIQSGGSVRVDSWDDWAEAIRTHTPSVLIAMPHTDQNQVRMEVLQIGESSNLSPTRVGHQYVQQPVGDVGPVLLLLGCTTSAPEIGYLGFVPRFLDSNAAVVIGTIAKVLGRHAGPVARLFLEEAVASDGMRVGEVVRRLRNRALIEGNLMGLTLAVYGDADWMFTD